MMTVLWAVRLQFFVAGALFATWGVHVPTVKAHFRLSEPSLAVAMLASGGGAVLALLVAGPTIARFGPRATGLVTGVAATACIGALLASDRYAVLIVLMFVFGSVFAIFDVVINVVASDCETQAARPLMSGLHGMFSVGGMAGAGLGSLLAGAGVAAPLHLVGVASVVALVVTTTGLALPPSTATPAASGPKLPTRRPVLLLGTLAALGLIAEGAMYDWSVLYLKQELQSPASVAALGYAAFSAAMAAGRFGGDAVRRRLSAPALVRLSGALAALGMALALLAASPVAALVGFAITGFGLANVVPVLFSAAGRLDRVAAADGIAGVSALGYLGLMVGPPMIGVLAHAGSLATALWTVVVFAAVLAMAARAVLKEA